MSPATVCEFTSSYSCEDPVIPSLLYHIKRVLFAEVRNPRKFNFAYAQEFAGLDQASAKGGSASDGRRQGRDIN